MSLWKLGPALLTLALLQAVSITAANKNMALKFGKTFDDFVQFTPDMHPVKDSVSICAWFKKQSPADRPGTWFTYWTSSYIYEIVISDNAHDNYMLHGNLDVRSSVTVPQNTWTHYCTTWSSNTRKVYYNGVLVGTKNTSSRSMTLGGFVLLGHDKGSVHEHEIFGGTLFKLNVFTKELSGGEVREMWEGGLCSRQEAEYGRLRYIKWEDILLEPRNGDVTEVDTGCSAVEWKMQHWNVLYKEAYFNNVFTEGMLEELRSSWDVLEYFVGTNMTDGVIRHFKIFQH